MAATGRDPPGQAGEDRRVHRLRPGRTALLVIDMQRGFLEPGAALEVPAGRAIIPNLRQLIEACRERQVPVIFTQFVYATAVPCLRGDPFGPEHLPARPGEPTGFGRPSGNCLVPPEARAGARFGRDRPGTGPPAGRAGGPRPHLRQVLRHPAGPGTPEPGHPLPDHRGRGDGVCVNCTLLSAATATTASRP